MDLRCVGKLHGKVDGDVIEVACKSRHCGWAPGIIVLHKFSVASGELIGTQKFKNPDRSRNATQHDPASVRSA